MELEELSFYKTRLSEDSIDYLVKNVTPKLSKLSLYTIIRDAIVIDKYIQVLVSRCTNLTELSLSGSGFTNNSVNYIIENLQSTLEKLCLFQTRVSVTKLFELKAMKKLTILDFYRVHDVWLSLPGSVKKVSISMMTILKIGKL